MLPGVSESYMYNIIVRHKHSVISPYRWSNIVRVDSQTGDMFLRTNVVSVMTTKLVECVNIFCVPHLLYPPTHTHLT